MASTQSNITGAASPPTGGVAAILPLCLLESLRDHDRPAEVLEDEDLTISLPRRLGLNDVIDSQIRRYEEARRKGRSVPAAELTDLLRLVIRRPDAEAILNEAGRGLVARWARGREGRRARFGRLMPRRLASGMLRRALVRLARRTAAGARVDVHHSPIRVSIHGCLAARVDPGGAACLLYTSAFSALAGLYMRDAVRIVHTHCQTRSADACEWELRT